MGCGMLAAPGWPQSVECGGLDLDQHKMSFIMVYHGLSWFIIVYCVYLVLLHFFGEKSDSTCFNHLNVLCDSAKVMLEF